MKIAFTIYGNHENAKGNPIPYHRTTQRSKWSAEAKRYEKWKDYVRYQFLQAAAKFNLGKETKTALAQHYVYKQKMIFPEHKARTDLYIYWANHSHGDPDNMLKGINDALFDDDKLVAGSVDFCEEPTGQGRIEVALTI